VRLGFPLNVQRELVDADLLDQVMTEHRQAIVGALLNYNPDRQSWERVLAGLA